MKTDRELWRFIISALITLIVLITAIKALPTPIEAP
jgi:hypothetical protein